MKKLFTCLLLFFTLQYATAQSIAITEPCNCSQGIDLDGDGINDLALVTITITEPQGLAWNMVVNDNLLDAQGMTLPFTIITNNGDDTFTFQAYLPADGTTSYTVGFTNPINVAVGISGGPCNVCPPSEDVDIPTVGEWGLIIFGLLMTTVAVVGIRQRREQEVYG